MKTNKTQRNESGAKVEKKIMCNNRMASGDGQHKTQNSEKTAENSEIMRRMNDENEN